MDLELEIEKGGLSDNLGKHLESVSRTDNISEETTEQNGVSSRGSNLTDNRGSRGVDNRASAAENLNTSLTNFGGGMVNSATAGAAGVVASTGANFGNGSTDLIIADNIAAAISLTGTEGLTNLKNSLEAYSLEMAKMGLNAPEELVELLLKLLEEILAENGVIDTIKKGLDATKGMADLLKMGLDYATSIATIMANIAKLATKLDKMQDVDVVCIPSVKSATNAFTASLEENLKSQYQALRRQLLMFINALNCSGNDITLDGFILGLNNSLYVLEPILDLVLKQYIGLTTAEVRSICNLGFAYIGMIQRSAAKKRKQKESKSDLEKEVYELNENGEVVRDPSTGLPIFKSTVDESLKNLSEDELKKELEKRKENAKKKWEGKFEDMSKEEAKAKLKKWLDSQSILIQNAFWILQIKDTIKHIQYTMDKIANASIESRVDFLNMLKDILDLFADFGITPDAKGITVDDLKALGIAAIGTALATSKNLGDLVQANVDQLNAQNGTLASLDKARGVVQVGANVAGAPNPNEAGGLLLTDLAAGGTDWAINTVIDAGQNVDLNAVAQNAGETMDGAKNAVNGAKNFLKNGLQYVEPFEFTQLTDNKNITVNVTINKKPALHLIRLNAFFDNFKQSNGSSIFNSGQRKNIKDSMYDAWAMADTVEITINAKVEGITKFYKFVLTPNKEMMNEPDELETEDTSIGLPSFSNLESQLTKVNVNIDMAYMDEILQGKLPIFDEIVQLMKVLLPLVKTIYTIVQLLENYDINKAWEKDHEKENFMDILALAYYDILGLKAIFDLQDTNFFPIRTEKMAKWATDTFKEKPNEQGFMVVGKVDNALDVLVAATGNNLDTVKINTYCANNGITPEIPLDLFKGTTLYYDEWAIKNGGKKDGSMDGLDYMEVNVDSGKVFFDPDHLSPISSLILRAKKNNANPNYVIPNVDQEPNTIADLMKLTSFLSDEMDGMQTINVCDLNLCPPELEEEPAAGESAVIVEFGDKYTLGDAVNYLLLVKPGQTIKLGQNIARIKSGKNWINVKTQYTGVVRSANKENTEFFHLYPQDAKRHFIIDLPSPCLMVDYNANDVNELLKKFKKATELEAFIINCIAPSILPILLYKSKRDQMESYLDEDGNLLSRPMASNVFSSYNQRMKEYDDTFNELANELLRASSSDNMKASLKSNEFVLDGFKFNSVSEKALTDLKDHMLGLRKLMIKESIKVYTNAKNVNSRSKIYGDNTYNDCLGLAYDANFDFKRTTSITINDETHNDEEIFLNYYFNLLKLIPEQKSGSAGSINLTLSDIQGLLDAMYLPDASILAGEHVNMDNKHFNIGEALENLTSFVNDTNNDEDSYLKKYKRLLQEIIDTRLAYEKISISSLKTKFNGYYKSKVTHYVGTNTPNYFRTIYNKFKTKLDDKDSILEYIKKEFNGPSREEYDSCNLAYLMFDFINNTNVSNISTETLPYESYKDLIKDEYTKLTTFWNKVVSEYNGSLNLDKVIKDLENYAKKLGNQAQWPLKMDFKLNNTSYELYTFMNGPEVDKSCPDILIYDELPSDISLPTEAPIDLESDMDILEPSKITIFDYTYWLVYMLNATIFTLIPSYWGDGFDIPPFMVPTPLPAIYLPIAPPVYIPKVEALLVFGIALRGMWPAPIVLIVNLSSSDLDGTIFLKMAIAFIEDVVNLSINLIENGIPAMIKAEVNKLISENQTAQKIIEKFRTYSSIISAIPVEDKALIEKKFNEEMAELMAENSPLNKANSKLSKTRLKLQEANKNNQEALQKEILEKIDSVKLDFDETITESNIAAEWYYAYANGEISKEELIEYYKLKKEAKNQSNKYDTRLVVTREEYLGLGTEPM